MKLILSFIFTIACSYTFYNIGINSATNVDPTIDTVYVTQDITEWQLFTLALIDVESEYDTLAENKYTKARGILQIMPIFVKEANRLQDTTKYEWIDAWNVGSSLEMFNIINPEQDIDLAIKRHNPNAKGWYSRRVKDRMDKFRLIFKIKEGI